MIELISDLFVAVVDSFQDPPSIPIDFDDVLLIGGAIYVANLTVKSIQDELRNHQELKEKGATQVVIKDFINQNGYTEVSFAALNDQNKQVGTFSMKGRSCSGLYKGQKISI